MRQLHEAPDDPTFTVWVQSVVVVKVRVVERVGVRIRLQFDDAAAADVRAGLLRAPRQGW